MIARCESVGRNLAMHFLMALPAVASIMLLAIGFGSPVGAAPITFIHEGSGSGTLGGIPFATLDFVITGVGDTTDRVVLDPGRIFAIEHLSASITLDGLGTFDFLIATQTFTNDDVVGFARPYPGSDLFDKPEAASLSPWEMLSSIGPITGEAVLFQWDVEPIVNTTGGILFFDTQITLGTFTAVVPEPSTVAHFKRALILPGLMWLHRRRRRLH
jgi:hypothetical protein